MRNCSLNDSLCRRDTFREQAFKLCLLGATDRVIVAVHVEEVGELAFASSLPRFRDARR
jgi:hypothetical protein